MAVGSHKNLSLNERISLILYFEIKKRVSVCSDLTTVASDYSNAFTFRNVWLPWIATEKKCQNIWIGKASMQCAPLEASHTFIHGFQASYNVLVLKIYICLKSYRKKQRKDAWKIDEKVDWYIGTWLKSPSNIIYKARFELLISISLH